MRRWLTRGAFARSVAVLAGGTAFAQGLGVLVLPALSRLYTPEDFGSFGAFTALLGVICVVSAFRYEIAIPLPECDQEAANLLVISLALVAAFSLMTAILIAILGGHLADWMKTPALKNVLWILPIGVLVTGAYNVFQFWATRKKAYSKIARTKVEQAIGAVGTQIGLGWLGFGGIGLAFGQLVSNGAGIAGLAKRTWSDGRVFFLNFNLASLRKTAHAYRRFPMYSTFESFANSAGLQIPLIVIGVLAGGKELGYVMFAMRVLQAPMSLIGGAIAQVYYSQAITESRNKNLMEFTAKILKKLIIIGAPLMICAMIFAPMVFGSVFGESWKRSGELVLWLAPFFLFQFLASPLSMALHVLNAQKYALALQIAGFFLRIFAVLLFSQVASEAFAISSAIFYFFYLGVILVTIRRSEKQHRD